MRIYTLVTCFEATLCPTLEKNISLNISTVLLHLQGWGNADISVTILKNGRLSVSAVPAPL